MVGNDAHDGGASAGVVAAECPRALTGGMRILILANERFVFQSVNPLDLAESLAQDGHDVTVAAPFGREAIEWNEGRGFRLIRLSANEGRLGNFRFWTSALACTASVKPDIVIGVNAVGLVAADLAKSLRLVRASAWYALELSLPEENRSSLSVRWQTWRGRSSDFVIATGKDRAHEMVERFRLQRRPFVVANAPVKAPRPGRSLLRQQAVAKGLCAARYVVYAGSNGSANCLVEAARASALWKVDAGLVIAAFGGTSDDIAALLRAVSEPGTRAIVVPQIEGGRDSLLEWVVGADAGLVLFDHRSYRLRNFLWYTPNKLFDYMACGLPVVASDNPSLLEDVQAAGCGTCCDPRSPDAIAAAVDAVFNNREAMAARASELFADRYNYVQQTAPFRAALASIRP